MTKNAFDTHQLEKSLSRSEKESDINLATNNKNHTVCCFDLQAVLPVPCGDVSQFFYKRRLSCFNFTIFDIVKKQGYCYVWYEGVGKRGVNEIGSFIYKYLNECHVEEYFIVTIVQDKIRVSL